jgi:hypothetical protein
MRKQGRPPRLERRTLTAAAGSLPSGSADEAESELAGGAARCL